MANASIFLTALLVTVLGAMIAGSGLREADQVQASPIAVAEAKVEAPILGPGASIYRELVTLQK